MRKVCKRKHYDTTTDPLSYVLRGMLPVAGFSPITTVRIKNHSALQAAIMGKAVFTDRDALVAAFNMSEALANLGIGTEYLAEIKQANVSMTCMQLRGGLTGLEIRALQLAMDVHDAQLDDSRTTIEVMDAAIRIVKKTLQIKKQQRKQRETA